MSHNKLNKNKDMSCSLAPELYHVAREKGTERAFTGRYVADHRPGTYFCACCGQPLFESQSKFDSGSGWPSFTEPTNGAVLVEKPDHSHGMHRTEVLCRQCDAHLGHVFPDGPGPNGLRYCINSVSLMHEADKSSDD